MGIKNLYYANTDDGDKQTAMENKNVQQKQVVEESGCASGSVCSIIGG